MVSCWVFLVKIWPRLGLVCSLHHFTLTNNLSGRCYPLSTLGLIEILVILPTTSSPTHEVVSPTSSVSLPIEH